MNRDALSLFWCSIGVIAGALATLRVPAPIAIGSGVVTLIVILVCVLPGAMGMRKKRLPRRSRTTPTKQVQKKARKK